MKNHIYHGKRYGIGNCVVTVDSKPLNPRNDLRDHSPDGFEFGYGGSGPSQLALAMLVYEYHDESFALEHYQEFKWAVISLIQANEWEMNSEQIRKSLSKVETP